MIELILPYEKESREYKHFLYVHYRKDTGAPFYVGIGNNKYTSTYSRAFAKNSKNRNKEWIDFTNNVECTVKILFQTNTKKEIFEKEREFIKLYGRKDLGEGELLNKTDGGLYDYNYSPTLRKKLSDKLTKNNPNFDGKYWVGKTHSEESKLKMSEARKGKRWCPLPLKAIYQYDLEGNFIKKWECANRITENNPIYNTRYLQEKCLKNNIKPYKGFIWSYNNLNNFNNE